MDAAANDRWNLVAEACTFAFPLVLCDATARATTEKPQADGAPMTNRLLHSRRLADADTRSVVTPNVDTLYTQTFFDLGDQAYVLHKPAADRFFSVELLDAWTNAAAILGTAGDTEDARTYLLTGPAFAGSVPSDPDLVHVPLPTSRAWMIARTVVFGADDYPNVYRLQDAMKLLPYRAFAQSGLERPTPASDYSSDLAFVPIRHVVGLSIQQFFDTANALMVANPPAPDDAPLLERLRPLGVGPGLAFDASLLGEGVDERWRALLGGLTASLLEQTTEYISRWGVWHVYNTPIAEFGTAYAYRALIALGGLGANPVSVAVYPKAETDSAGERLDGTHAYRIHFEAASLEPAGPHGFWSITAYGEDNFLIDNELDRYAVNDRSGAVPNVDGSLDILVQAARPQDERLLPNWLPVRDKPFHVHLRIYLPTADVLAGTWKAPRIERVD